ncbi:hypothetical protein [Roseateles sp. L2-2]|uniref:hypothetical protein n=1 Tax=Roseateles sp. L2-2 TaxID=3422597 RepID=UPI003D36D953
MAAVLKFDSSEAPFAVYCELAAARIGALLGVPVAPGALCELPDSLAFASLLIGQPGARFPHVEGGQAQAVVDRYPAECAGLLVFDVLIGNWDRYGNVKAGLRAHVPGFILGFDHANSLLMAGEEPLQSVGLLAAEGSPILHRHLFGAYLLESTLEPWIAKAQALRADLVRCCVVGHSVNGAELWMQGAIAYALSHRLGHLRGLCRAVLQGSGGSR